MATSSSISCGVCDGKQVTRRAEFYCPECEEGLCSECHQHHSLSRASKNHEIVSIENYKKLPNFMKTISENCSEHEMKFTVYCPQHDKLCCPRCLSSRHHDCTNIKAVTDLTKNAKKSSLVSICEKKLNEISVFIHRVLTDRKQKLESIENKKSNFKDEIKSIRFSINSHLDKLEESIMAELDNTVGQTKLQIEANTKELDETLKKVDDYAHGLTSVLEYGSDLYTFLGTRLIQDEITTQERYLRSISEDGSLNNFRLELKVNKKLKDMLSEIKEFGSVAVEVDPPSFVYSGAKDTQMPIASITRPPSSRSINDIKLTFLSTIDVPGPDIRGCTVCSDGKMVFTDYCNHRIIIMNQDGKVKKKKIAIKYPCDVTVINDNTVAVSVIDGIKIIDIISGQTKQAFDTEYPTYVLSYYKGSLLWCEMSKGIKSKQLPDGDICTVVQQKDLPNCSYITAYNDKIYQTNYNTKTVTCFTSRGETEWEFRDDVLLPDPIGVTVDKDGFVYVTSERSNNVVVISSDGKQGRQLLGETDGMKKPYGIYFDKTKNNLLITNKRGPTFLYHL